MNAESIAVLQVMICETKHEIQGGGGVASVTKNLGSLRVKKTYFFSNRCDSIRANVHAIDKCLRS